MNEKMIETIKLRIFELKQELKRTKKPEAIFNIQKAIADNRSWLLMLGADHKMPELMEA